MNGRVHGLFRAPGVLAAIAACVPLGFYIRTSAPGLTFIDSGELAAVATNLGIAHPTGYPLFTLLGWVAAHLPIGAEPVVRLNLMAGIFTATAAGIFFLFFRHLLLYGVAGRGEGVPKGVADSAALTGGWLLAFSETFWSQGLAVEVYSLHLLLIGLLGWSFARALFPAHERESERWWNFCAFVGGLSFANHMTTILVVPGFALLYVTVGGRGRGRWIRLIRLIPFFLLGLTPYMYLPLRAAASPPFNWGDPETLERFLWHVGGKQYRVWIFSSTEAAGRQFAHFVRSLPGEFGSALPLLFGGAGLVLLALRRMKLFWGSVSLFLACVLYSINYDIHDIDSYFLLAYVVIAFWSAFGVAMFGRWLVTRGWKGVRWSVTVAAVLLAIEVGANFVKVDLSQERSVEEYTSDMFGSLAPGALVISYQWDFWLSASYYVQSVRGVRPDVAVVDKELLRRSWYLRDLEVRYPWLIAASRGEVERFLRELDRFERGLPYDGGRIQRAFEEMIRSFIRRSLPERPVYVTAEIEREFTSGWERVPAGLAFLLVSDTAFHATPAPGWVPRGGDRRGELEERVPRLYADALVARGEYYYRKRGYSEDVKHALKLALLFDANHPGARKALEVVRD